MSILLTFLLALLPAFAQNTADEAELNFQLARESYQKGDFETALFHFMVSNRLSPNRNVTFNIGRTYHALRRYPEAYRWYYDALNSEEPASERVLAQIRSSLDRLRPQVALLSVETDPPGATVYLRRKNLGAVGVTPLELPLQPNAYNVIVSLEGYEDVETEVYDLSRPGAVQEVALDLVPIVGQVTVAGEAGATMHLGSEDGQVLCELPCTVDVPVGRQLLFFKKQGFRSLPSLIDVERDEQLDVTAEMLPITGTLVVDADERGALIEVDGVPAGYTPAVLTDVQVGSHTLRISSRGYDPVDMPIEVIEGETVDVGRVMMNPRFTVTAASRFAEEVSDAPASVTIIPREEIRAFGYQSLMEAIVGTRGVFETSDLVYRYVGFRGFGRLGDFNNRVLLTVDGHRWNENVFGSSYFGDDFLSDMQDVEQIEVVRGSGSALYGSNASLGVLNVVTAAGDSPYRPHISVTGADNAIRARVGAGVGDKDAGAWISLSGLYGPGRSYFFEEYADRPSQGVSENSDESYARTVAAKAWIGGFTIHGVYTGREKEVPTGAFGVNLGDHRNSSNDYRGFLEARYLGGSEKTNIDARVSVDYYRNRWFGPYGSDAVFQDRHDEIWLTGLVQLNQHVGDILSLTAGLNGRQSLNATLGTIAQPNIGVEPTDVILDRDAGLRTLSAYGVLDFHPGEIFRFNIGGRYDTYSWVNGEANFGSANPRGAVILTPGNETIKLVGGTAFRAPSSFELFYDDEGASQIIPAADDPLNPETMATVDLEWTHSFSEVLTTTVNGFYYQIDDVIADRTLAGGTLQKTNLEDLVRIAGAEAEVRRWWRSGWMAAAQVSFNQTREGDLLDGDRPINNPLWLASILAAAPLGNNTTVSTKLRGESGRLTNQGRLTDGALLWDVTLTGTLNQPQGVSWGLGIRNLLDWPTFYPGGSDVIIDQLPGRSRSFFATLRAGF